MPIAPAPTPWGFPPHASWDPDDDLVAVGADLEPGTLVTAYALGLFPMPVTLDAEEHLGWFSPVERGVLPLDGMRVSRSLRRSARDFEIRIDTAFDEVVAACGRPGPPGRLDHRRTSCRPTAGCTGSAGPTRSRRGATDRLAGGLYGVSVGGLFAGRVDVPPSSATPPRSRCWRSSTSSATSTPTAGCSTCSGRRPHLASLGVVRRPRAEYLESLEACLRLPLPTPFRVDDQG